jgi:hypothetical protein
MCFLSCCESSSKPRLVTNRGRAGSGKCLIDKRTARTLELTQHPAGWSTARNEEWTVQNAGGFRASKAHNSFYRELLRKRHAFLPHLSSQTLSTWSRNSPFIKPQGVHRIYTIAQVAHTLFTSVQGLTTLPLIGCKMPRNKYS